jgi:ABC-type glycerol-3-phosphate transport system substrate-binding protein
VLKKAVGVIVVVALVGGCGGSDNEPESKAGKGPVAAPTEPVTISFASWVAQERGMKKLYKQFRKEYPNITVEFEEIPSEEASRKLTTQIAGGNAPDAAYIDAGTTAQFAGRGALVNLDDYIAGSDTVKADDYVDAFRESTLFEDSMYGLPFDGESTGLFYRTDLFEQAGIAGPPKTWEEFEATAAKLTKPDEKQYGFALFTPAPESGYYWYPWLWQAGGELMNEEETEVTFTSPEAKQAAEFYVNLTKYAPRDYLNSNSYDGRIAFANGSVGMYMAGAWLAGVLREEFPKIDGKWASAPLPEGPNGCHTTIAGDNLVLFEGSENQDAAWLWIEFLSRPESQKVWTVDDPFSTIMPTRTSLLESPELAESKPDLEGFAEMMDCGRPPLRNPKWPQVEEALSNQLGKAMYGEQSAAEALDAAAAEAQEILGR